MRKLLLVTGFLVALSGAALARGGGNNNGSNFGAFAGVGGVGGFVTQGQAGAVSAFGGTAEAYANGTAGLALQNGTFGGFQTNQAGAQTWGNSVAAGQSTSVAAGLGGFVGFAGFAGF